AAHLEHVTDPVVVVRPAPVASGDGVDELVEHLAARALPGGGERLAGRRGDDPVDPADQLVERPGGDVSSDGLVTGGGSGGARGLVDLPADVDETEGPEPLGPAAGPRVQVDDHATPFRRCWGWVSRSISPRSSAMTRSRWATLSSRSPMTTRSIRRRAARARPRRRESRAWWSRSAHTWRALNALARARSSAARS